MANAHNKQEASAFQDDLDAIFNNVNIEEYSDTFKMDGDDFELLKKPHDAKANSISETLSANVNQSFMVADMERPDLKLVKNESKSNRKQDIDALLNSIAEDDDFSFDDPISADSFKNDVRAIVANKNVESLKRDDFDAFDEFGDIDDFGEINHSPSDFKAGKKSGKPESLIDLEETLGVNFSQKHSKVDLDSVSIDNEDDYFFNTINDKVEVLTPLADPKMAAPIAPESSSIVSQIIEKQSNRLGDETVGLFDNIEDDDFDDIPSISVTPAPIMAVKTEDEMVGLFDSIEDDDFMPINVDTNAPHTDSQEDNSLKNGGFNEIVDDFDTPIAVAADTAAVSAPVAKANLDVEVKKDNVDLEAKIAALWTVQNEMKQQIAEIALQKTDAEPLDDMALLDLQSKEQNERKQLQDLVIRNQKKSSKLLYGIAGVSLLSLSIGGGLLAYGLGPLSDIKALSAKSLVVDQELAALKTGMGATTGTEGESVAQLAEQVKNIRALLTGDKAVLAHGLHAGVSKSENKSEPKPAANQVESAPETPPATKTLHDIQSKEDKSIRVIAAVDKTAAPTKKTRIQWVANLLSVRQDAYAKQKAAEFAKQGIATIVVPINIKGQTVYILRSNGFATQDQALAYATQAKKTLNLTSILVTPDE